MILNVKFIQFINKKRLCYGVHHSNLLSRKHHLEIVHSVFFSFFNQQKLYNDKQDVMDELYHQYHIPLLKYVNNTALIIERKQNLDSTAYEKYINK